MLNEKETQIILEKFFNECLRYWRMQNKDEREAFEYAIRDIKRLKYNPYVPCGEEIDIVTKAKFIRYREMDLGKEN